MASITCCGTCVPPGPSRKTAGCPLTVCASAGNCERTQARSNAVDAEEEEACSAMGIADILIRARANSSPRRVGGNFRLRWFNARVKPFGGALLGDAFVGIRIGLLALSFVGGVQPDARDSCRSLD